MGRDVCGNCANFKPKPGEKFFNCTSAEHAGLKYAMQVRADTRSCDVFVPFNTLREPTPAEPTPMTPAEHLSSEEHPELRERQPAVGLCPRGRTVLIVGLVVVVLLLSWLLYTCASSLISTPTPTPTPTPVPTPVPTPIVNYYDINTGEWVVSSELACKVYSPKTAKSWLFGIETIDVPGTKFISIHVTVTNASKTRQHEVGPSQFSLTDSQGRQYPYYYHRFQYKPFTGVTLSPGETATGEILWLVPDYASGFEVSFTLDAVHTPKVIAKWKLPW